LDKSQYATTPDYSLKLTTKGIHQAQQAGMEIKKIIGNETVYVYLSPFFRTRETYQHITESIKQNVVKAMEDPRIREQDWDILETPTLTKR